MTAVLFGFLTGELFNKSAVLSLRCALAASMAGAVFPLHHPLHSRALSRLSICLTVAAILAWHKNHLTGIWRSIFALSTAIVLFLNITILVVQVMNHMSLFKAWPLAPFNSPSILAQLVVMMLFVVIGIVATRRFRDNPPH